MLYNVKINAWVQVEAADRFEAGDKAIDLVHSGAADEEWHDYSEVEIVEKAE